MVLSSDVRIVPAAITQLSLKHRSLSADDLVVPVLAAIVGLVVAVVVLLIVVVVVVLVVVVVVVIVVVLVPNALVLDVLVVSVGEGVKTCLWSSGRRHTQGGHSLVWWPWCGAAPVPPCRACPSMSSSWPGSRSTTMSSLPSPTTCSVIRSLSVLLKMRQFAEDSTKPIATRPLPPILSNSLTVSLTVCHYLTLSLYLNKVVTTNCLITVNMLIIPLDSLWVRFGPEHPNIVAKND